MFKAKDIMTQPVITVTPDTPIYDAIRLLSSRRLTGLPVVDEDLELVGILTEKDVLHLLNEHQDRSDQIVADFMCENVTHFDANDNLIDLCDCLVQNAFRRLPITEENRLAGIISRSDVIDAILKIKHQMPVQG